MLPLSLHMSAADGADDSSCWKTTPMLLFCPNSFVIVSWYCFLHDVDCTCEWQQSAECIANYQGPTHMMEHMRSLGFYRDIKKGGKRNMRSTTSNRYRTRTHFTKLQAKSERERGGHGRNSIFNRPVLLQRGMLPTSRPTSQNSRSPPTQFFKSNLPFPSYILEASWTNEIKYWSFRNLGIERQRERERVLRCAWLQNRSKKSTIQHSSQEWETWIGRRV